MTNMDYVIVGPGPSLADVVAAVRSASGGIVIADGVVHLPDDEPASLHVIPDPLEDGGTVVQVVYASDPVSLRHELARKVYDELVAATDWDLELDSDDTEDTIATRIKARR